MGYEMIQPKCEICIRSRMGEVINSVDTWWIPEPHVEELHDDIDNLKSVIDELWIQIIKVAKGESNFEYASIKVEPGQTITKEQIEKAFRKRN